MPRAMAGPTTCIRKDVQYISRHDPAVAAFVCARRNLLHDNEVFVAGHPHREGIQESSQQVHQVL